LILLLEKNFPSNFQQTQTFYNLPRNKKYKGFKMKNLTTLSIITATILGLNGCGSSSTTPATQNAQTLTGYYVDEIIVGVTYTCSSSTSTATTGTTGDLGDFNFVAGQTCTFSVGGITVETTGTLEDNETVITEDDADDLGYLLTVDNNANPNDGILVTPSVESTATVYNTTNANSTTTDVDLNDFASVLSANDNNYNGVASTTTQTTTQVVNAQASQCVRNLIGGQTWYIAEALSSEVTKYVVDVPVVNTLVTKAYPTLVLPNTHPTATEQVMIVGNQLWIELDVDLANGLDAGRDFARFQACKLNSPTFPNYLEAKFHTANTNQLASYTVGTDFRWYNNLADAITYANTGI
jgi:hypothetical protein